MDVSPECDCWNHNDAAIIPNIGIAASFDPIALDRACADMEYLEEADSLSTGKPLNRNSAADYWIIFRNALNLAYRDRRISEKIVDFLDYIKWVPTIKESLTLDEVRSLFHTPW